MRPTALWLASLAFLAGCSSLDMPETMDKVNQATASYSVAKAELYLTAEQRKAQLDQVQKLLEEPLSMENAVRLSMLNSPAVQSMLAKGWAASARAAQTGRIPNPVFNFERVTVGDELEIGRLLSFGLIDILTVPLRQEFAAKNLQLNQLMLVGSVVDQITEVRKAWVKAVAAQQALTYSKKVKDSAAISADLARRMQKAGNFTRSQSIREQLFSAEAAVAHATIMHEALQAREDLFLMLGLGPSQADALKLPARLPDLPELLIKPDSLGIQAVQERLDIKLAQAAFDAALSAQNANLLSSFTDVELGIRRDSVSDRATGESSHPKGFELDIRLPIFDWGGLKRQEMKANTLIAANQMESLLLSVQSGLRTSYSAYQTSFSVARQYQTEILPMVDALSEENVLNYNGMFIGVFELLAEQRRATQAVLTAISSQKQYWLAEVALKAELIGRPQSIGLQIIASDTVGSNAGGSH